MPARTYRSRLATGVACAALTITLWAGVATATATAADPAAEVVALLDAGRAQEAYERLLPLEQANAGTLDYDLLLGRAALESGHLTRAIFALERVLAVAPDHGPARLLIGRAYFEAGESKAAEDAFTQVRGAPDLPPEVQLGIDRYMEALDRGASPTTWSGFAKVAFGYDTNVTAGTGQDSVFIPLFAGVATLAPGGRQQQSWFQETAAGLGVEHRVDDTWAFLAGFGVSQRGHFRQSQMDTVAYDGSLGISGTFGDTVVQAGPLVQRQLVDGDHYRDVFGATVQVRHAFSETTVGGAYAQHLLLSYKGTQDFRDARRTVLGVNGAYVLGDAEWTPVLFGQAYGGGENADRGGQGHLGNSFGGARVGVEVSPRDDLRWVTAINGERRVHDQADPLFLTTRRDTQVGISTGLTYTLDSGLSITPEIAYTDQSSNIAINDYTRTTATVSFRYAF